MLQRPQNGFVQKRFFNGKDHIHAVKCFFVFLFDGTIGTCVLNDPGSTHDCKMMVWSNLKDVMAIYPSHLYILGDAGTCSGREWHLVRPMRVDEGRSFIQISRELFVEMTERSKTISRYRVAAEWGNKMVKDYKIFERPLTTDTRRRQLIFLNVVHLIN